MLPPPRHPIRDQVGSAPRGGLRWWTLGPEVVLPLCRAPSDQSSNTPDSARLSPRRGRGWTQSATRREFKSWRFLEEVVGQRGPQRLPIGHWPMSLVSPGGSRLPRLKGSVPGANPFLPGPVDRVLSEGQCRAGSGPDAKLAPGRAAGARGGRAPRYASPSHLDPGEDHPDAGARAQSCHNGPRPGGQKDPPLAFTAPRATAPQGRSGKGPPARAPTAWRGSSGSPLGRPLTPGAKVGRPRPEDHLPHGQAGGSSSWSAPANCVGQRLSHRDQRGQPVTPGGRDRVRGHKGKGNVTRCRGHKGNEIVSQGYSLGIKESVVRIVKRVPPHETAHRFKAQL